MSQIKRTSASSPKTSSVYETNGAGLVITENLNMIPWSCFTDDEVLGDMIDGWLPSDRCGSVEEWMAAQAVEGLPSDPWITRTQDPEERFARTSIVWVDLEDDEPRHFDDGVGYDPRGFAEKLCGGTIPLPTTKAEYCAELEWAEFHKEWAPVDEAERPVWNPEVLERSRDLQRLKGMLDTPDVTIALADVTVNTIKNNHLGQFWQGAIPAEFVWDGVLTVATALREECFADMRRLGAEKAFGPLNAYVHDCLRAAEDAITQSREVLRDAYVNAAKGKKERTLRMWRVFVEPKGDAKTWNELERDNLFRLLRARYQKATSEAVRKAAEDDLRKFCKETGHRLPQELVPAYRPATTSPSRGLDSILAAALTAALEKNPDANATPDLLPADKALASVAATPAPNPSEQAPAPRQRAPVRER